MSWIVDTFKIFYLFPEWKCLAGSNVWKNHLRIAIWQSTCCRWIVQQSYDYVLLVAHRCHRVDNSLQHQQQQQFYFLTRLTPFEVFITDAVKPGGGEKTLWLSCLPPPNRVLSIVEHLNWTCFKTLCYYGPCANQQNSIFPQDPTDVQMKQIPTVFCPHLVTQSTKLTNAWGAEFDVIDSRWHIF